MSQAQQHSDDNSNANSNTNNSANVDVNEVNKFEAMASRWWDPEGECKPLHEINPLRLDYIDSLASIKDKKIIDVGCGGGILSESMALRGADVTGIDMGENPLAIARLHLHETGASVNYQKSSAEEYAELNANSFDIVTCMELLEHVPDPASTIASCVKLVKPGGHVFFSTINRNAKAYAMAILGAEYIMQILPRGTHDFTKFIKPSELEKWARHAGLTLKDLKGISYNPFNKLFFVSNDVSVNYMACMSCPK